jgi:hypothetical protein
MNADARWSNVSCSPIRTLPRGNIDSEDYRALDRLLGTAYLLIEGLLCMSKSQYDFLS